jgi:hypothetical protein
MSVDKNDIQILDQYDQGHSDRNQHQHQKRSN